MNNTLEYSVGDSVTISDFYLSNYIIGASLKDKEAIVTRVTSRKVTAAALREDRQLHRMYADRYGELVVFDVIGLEIKYPDNAVYLVSPFGYKKVVK